MTKPIRGTPKAYWAKAYLFQTAGDESAWQEWDIDLAGLATLPEILATRVAAFLGPLSENTVDEWRRKRLPVLRNSLSYHDGERGVTTFTAVTQDNRAYPIRVFAGRVGARVQYSFVAALFEREKVAELQRWALPASNDLLSQIGWLRTSVGQWLQVQPTWSVNSAVHKIRRMLRSGGTSVAIHFQVDGVSYALLLEARKYV